MAVDDLLHGLDDTGAELGGINTGALGLALEDVLPAWETLGLELLDRDVLRRLRSYSAMPSEMVTSMDCLAATGSAVWTARRSGLA